VKYSVVIPCYNRAHSIEQSIRSALAQSHPPTEIIVVDDGSTDDGPRIASSIGPQVRVIRQSNAGAAAARNRGLMEAAGEWIAFLDSDDVWHPDKMRCQAAAIAALPRADVVFCDTCVVADGHVRLASRFELGGLEESVVTRHGDFAAHDRSLFVSMLDRSRCITSAVAVRRGLPELRFPEHIWGSEDWALWLTLSLRYQMVSVSRVLTTMHTGKDNLTQQTAKLLRNDVRVLEDLLSDPILTPHEHVAAERFLIQRRVAAVYHSLVAGEATEARRILRQTPRQAFPPGKWYVYRLASRLPRQVLRTLSNYRLGDSSL